MARRPPPEVNPDIWPRVRLSPDCMLRFSRLPWVSAVDRVVCARGLYGQEPGHIQCRSLLESGTLGKERHPYLWRPRRLETERPNPRTLPNPGTGRECYVGWSGPAPTRWAECIRSLRSCRGRLALADVAIVGRPAHLEHTNQGNIHAGAGVAYTNKCGANWQKQLELQPPRPGHGRQPNSRCAMVRRPTAARVKQAHCTLRP